jgi:LmbE family N-acetylglucosaminyl deacetylase
MRVLAIVAHPDDEVLGCGATLAKHAQAGDEVRVLILGTGAMVALRVAAQAAAKILGYSVTVGTFPDQRFDSVDLLDVVRYVEMHVKQVQPEVVYTHAAGDLNVDHRVTHQATLTACRALPGSSVKRLLTCEDNAATVFVDVTDTWESKVKALECYSAEMRPYPHARSYVAVDAQAKLRGSQAGLVMAEAFTLVREVA